MESSPSRPGPGPSTPGESDDAPAGGPPRTGGPADGDAGDGVVGDADGVPGGAGTNRGRRWGRPRGRVLAAAVVLLALVVVGVVVLVTHLQAVARADRDRAVVDRSRSQVLDLVGVDPVGARAAFGRAIDGSTGEWRRRLEANEAALVDAVTASGVTSRAVVDGVVVQSIDDERAQVLVSATVATGTAGAPPGIPRPLRAVVALADVDDRWLVTDVVFLGGGPTPGG